MKHIAIFASGSGTNAQRIVEHFKGNKNIVVSLILTNNKNAYIIERAKKHGIPYIIFSREDFYQTELVWSELEKYHCDFIVLAGFLWLVPKLLINKYKNRIINIHPALLPKYGGKGMYGNNVHKAVIEAKEKESGISIHLVDEQYDKGNIVFQAICTVDAEDTAETLAAKIHVLEHEYYPKEIEKLLVK